MSNGLRYLHAELTSDLDRITRRFKNPKVTLIVRNPDLKDGDVVMGDDDLDLAIAAIQRLKDRKPVI